MKRTTWVWGILVVGLVACDKGSSGGTSAQAGGAAEKPSAPGRGHAFCKNPLAAGQNSTACSECVERECNATFNGMVSVCAGYFSCVEGCECTDRHCILGCVGKMDSACMSADVTKAQGKCEKDHCAAACQAHK